VRVARELGMPESLVEEVRQVALLHDIGKIGIPDAILAKPRPLDQDEWKIMHTHPAIGTRIAASIDTLAALALALRAEHERCDGQGYPDGLTGEQIPLASRIKFACDPYDAMTGPRPYRAKPMDTAAAAAELQATPAPNSTPTSPPRCCASWSTTSGRIRGDGRGQAAPALVAGVRASGEARHPWRGRRAARSIMRRRPTA
jgi:hypothetical protein